MRRGLLLGPLGGGFVEAWLLWWKWPEYPKAQCHHQGLPQSSLVGLGSSGLLWAPRIGIPRVREEAFPGHRGCCPWVVPSCLPPRLSGDQGTADLPQDSPCLLGLQSFIMEMGMTTEPQDQARGAAGPACVCVHVCRTASTGHRLG